MSTSHSLLAPTGDLPGAAALSPSVELNDEALALGRLFSSHAVTTTAAQQGLLAFVHFLIKEVNWFGPFVLAELGVAQLPPSSTTVQESPILSGKLEGHWQYKTLQSACQSTVAGIRAGAAIVCLALVAKRKDAPPSYAICNVSTASIEHLASVVRAVTDRAQHRLGGLFVAALAPRTPAALSELITQALESTDAKEFNLRWAREWQPWLATLTAPTKSIPNRTVEPELSPLRDPVVHQINAAAPPNAAPSNSGSSVGSSVTRRYRIDGEPYTSFRSRRVPTQPAPIDEVDYQPELEPLEEVSPAAQIAVPPTPKPGAPALRRAQERALCFQSIRQQNSDLLARHIEVLSESEIQFTRLAVNAAFKLAMGATDLKTAAQLVCFDLVGCTGCDWAVVAGINLIHGASSNKDRLAIAPEDGILWRPVIRPHGASTTQPPIELAAASIVHLLPLPLPPSVAERLKQVYSQMPSRNLGDLMGDLSSAKKDVKDVLIRASAVPRLTVSTSRTRRLVATRIMEVTHDVAATVLVCGDDLGKSNAPNFYYAPRVNDLVAQYKAAIWPIFGDQPGVETVGQMGDARVGSTGLVDDGALHRIFSEQATRINSFTRKLARVTTENLIEFHNVRTSYILSHFCAVTTHRPTRRLFQIKRSALDTQNRLALLEDKRVDVAHLFRPVALSEMLCSQLDLHIAHLQFIANTMPNATAAREAARIAVHSDGPLFFFINADGTTGADLATWVLHQPERLKALRANWYRHSFATRARELGATSPNVLVQCGHLEAAGYPFSRTGLLSPMTLTKSLGPVLAKFEQVLGFQLCATARSIDIGHDPPPLFHWTDHLSSHDQEVRSIDWKYLRKLASARRDNKELGKELGRSILTVLEPRILSLHDRLDSENEIKLTSDEKTLHRITSQQAAKILESLEAAAVTDVIRLAARQYIGAIFRRLKSRFRLDIGAFGNTFHYRIGDPTPFFRESLIALRQVSTLRMEFMRRAAEIRSRQPQAWRALSLILLAGIDSLAELELNIGGARSKDREGLVNLDGPSLLIDPVGQGRAAGFAGLAALALAGTERLSEIRLDNVSACIHAFFKPFFKESAPEDALALLLQCVGIANRYEQSGLVRYAVSPDGSVPAPYEVQKAFLVGGIPEPMVSDGPDAGDAGEAEGGTDRPRLEYQEPVIKQTKPERLRALRGARAFLKKLHRACRIHGEGPNARPATREQVAVNLDAICQQIPANGPTLIEHAIAFFALDLARDPSNNGKGFAPSTITTYVSAVSNLVDEGLVGRDLAGMEPEELDQEYLNIVQEHTETNTQRRTGVQLLRLHEVLTTRGLVDPLEDSQLREFLPASERTVDADLVLDAEFKLAIGWLEAQKAALTPQQADDRSSERRILQVTIIFLKLLRHSGCRFSEVAYLRHGDIFSLDNKLTIFVRKHRDRRLKTPAARRLIDFEGAGNQMDVGAICAFVQGERLRHGAQLRPRTKLFCDVDDARKSSSISRIRSWISRAFLEGAGRKLWPHRLRHLLVNEKVIAVISGESLNETAARSTWTCKARSLATAAATLGHENLTTTTSNYFHFAWAMRALERRDLNFGIDRRVIAGIAGITTAVAGKQKQRSVRKRDRVLLSSREDRWLDDVLVRRAPRLIPTTSRRLNIAISLNNPPFLTTQITRWLRRVINARDLAFIMGAEGYSDREVSRVITILDAIAEFQRFAFMTDNKVQRSVTAVPRAIDALDPDSIAKRIDTLPVEQRGHLAELILRCDQTRRAERQNEFYGSASDLLDLRSVIESLKLPEIQVRITPVATRAGSKASMALESREGHEPFDLLRWVFYAAVVADCTQRSVKNQLYFTSDLGLQRT